MLRQLARLTRPVAAGDGALAIAVYADATDRAFPAADLGYEGVACVDDAARAVVLLCDLWEATGHELFADWARGLMAFLHAMQLDDGRFVNFIASWDGRRNERGVTSFPGGGFWHARGVRALAKAWLVLGDRRAADGLDRGLARVLDARAVPPDVRSIHALMAVELLRSGARSDLEPHLARWCDEIVALRVGDVLRDNPDESGPHLWGHVQEGVLAEAGALLGRRDLIDQAVTSADGYLAPLVATGFDLPTVQPYGVASAIYGLDRLAAATGAERFATLARQAREWFDGRNTAGCPVYDREAGKVHDGIDDRILNEHSGAESNIVGAQALIDDLVTRADALVEDTAACFDPSVAVLVARQGRASSS